MAAGTEDTHWDEDVEALRQAARDSLDDPRIANYFSRGHVDKEAVFQAIDQDDLYEECRSTDLYQVYARQRAEVDKVLDRMAEISRSGAVNWKTIFMAMVLASFILLISTWSSVALTALVGLVMAFPTGFVVLGIFLREILFLDRDRMRGSWRFWAAYGLLYGIAAVFAVGIVVAMMSSKHATFSWQSVWLYANIAGVLVSVWLLGRKDALRDMRIVMAALVAWENIDRQQAKCTEPRKAWLDRSVQRVIYPNAVLAINGLLGKDATKLLVEQDSEGLRRLQDPAFTIPTRSELQLRNLLGRMDGGSIAVTGSRGAGKTTLLRRMCDPQDDSGQLSVYTSAPAVYVAREFLTELFQQVCDVYLRRYDRAIAEVRYRGLRTERDTGHLARRVARALGSILFVLCALVLVAVAVEPYLANVHLPAPLAHLPVGRWIDELVQGVKRDRGAIALVLLVMLLVVFWSSWFSLVRQSVRQWRIARRQARLIQRARSYSAHLKIERTTNLGASLGLPGMRGFSFSLSKGISEKYVPWSMPELVSKMRGFIADISQSAESTETVVIGIDEIDRIGSVEQAEQFIGEIKAVFGIPNCFFLVSVAEDVGFLFSRRSIAGQSTLENAFDDVVVVDPLGFDEARELLSKRVPGFTDSFVFLALALSGGLPREMIRVARRLVELNHRSDDDRPFPKIGDLAFRLVAEGVAEVLRTSRNQLARLSLPDSWGDTFSQLRDAIVILRDESVPHEQRLKTIGGLCSLRPPEAAGRPAAPEAAGQSGTGEAAAAKTLVGLAAFAGYGLTVIEAFDNDGFDLPEVRENVRDTSGGSYAELAAARLELGISPDSSRSIIRRFRARSGLVPLPEGP